MTQIPFTPLQLETLVGGNLLEFSIGRDFGTPKGLIKTNMLGDMVKQGRRRIAKRCRVERSTPNRTVESYEA